MEAVCALKPSRQTEQKLQYKKMSIAQPAAAAPRKKSCDPLRDASAVAATGGGRLNIAKLHSFCGATTTREENSWRTSRSGKGTTANVTGNAECIATQSGQCSSPWPCDASAGRLACAALSGSQAPWMWTACAVPMAAINTTQSIATTRNH